MTVYPRIVEATIKKTGERIRLAHFGDEEYYQSWLYENGTAIETSAERVPHYNITDIVPVLPERRPAVSEPEQADMERLQDKIEAILREWTDTAYALMRAGYSEKFSEYERGVIEGAKQMRWLHLAEPWHPAAKIIAAIHEEASRALADAWEAGRLAQERYEKGCMDQVYSLCSEEVPPLPRNPHKDGDA